MRLLNNFWLKVFALFMGFLVWLHVATEKTYNYELWIPVTEIALKDSLTLSEPPPDSLLVDVSATGKQLLREQWRQRGLRVNATQYEHGTYPVDLTSANTSLVGPTGDIELQEIVFPREITLRIDRQGSVQLPVIPNVEAEADDGFAVSRIRVVSPETVELTGPRANLRQFENLPTDSTRLSNLSNTITLSIPVSKPEGYGYTVIPDSVVVEVEIVPVKTRVYDNLPVIVYNAPPGRSVAVDPPFIRVELTGPPEDIDLLNRTALTVSVDYRQIDQAGSARIKVDCPINFRVKKTSTETVRVTATPDANPGN
jgi:YbbR domain-containing protein